MSIIKELYTDSSISSVIPSSKNLDVGLESRLYKLPLYDFQVEYSCSGKEVAQKFQDNPLLPGVILTKKGTFSGMISRHRFLEMMSRPYGIELFSRRSLDSLYNFVAPEVLILKGDTQIVEAARCCLRRSEELVYEPIVVEINRAVYRLLDMHQLLLADSQIHQLTCQLLNEQMDEQVKALSNQIEKMSSLSTAERMVSLGKIAPIIASEMKNPAFWADNLEFLFVYCQQIREVLLNCEVNLTQNPTTIVGLAEEGSLNFIVKDFPKTLTTMKTGSEKLYKIVGGLQILLERILNISNRLPH
ncbi:hypothetical protein [Lyngbya aestuarii]|uniref:hypothetical protein n=1 Tax=Lyngbya aestuarii TaxID=118322 RepID=UPI00403DBAD3